MIPPVAVSRRRALQFGAGLVALPFLPRSLAAALAPRIANSQGRAKRLVLLWLEGGPSQLETFDPKPGTGTGGPVGALSTDQADWSFSKNLPALRDRAEKLCVLRAVHSREGNHSRARELLKTGYVPNPAVEFPAVGAIVASQLGNGGAELPNYVQIGGAASPAGYLGVEAAPLVLSKADREIADLDYARGVDRDRMDRREDALEVLERRFTREGGAEAVRSYGALRERSRRLIETKLRSAFDVSAEKESVQDRYGRTDFGKGCLLARRLLEAGVTAVEVVLGGWDTHQDNFGRTTKLCSELDPAFAALLDDLDQRGMAADTLVVCMGEFGRTPKITAGDGRGHWPRNFCVALAGGAIRTGQAHGRTDETGESVVEGAVAVADLHATLGKAFGLDVDQERTVNGRPVTLVDPSGKPVHDVLRS